MKSPWEKRVGDLLSPPDFVWSYKPPDSQFYGGQPRVDWLACDSTGLFWMIEVKWLAESRASINLMTEVSPGQRDALNAVDSGQGIALLAIGRGSYLFVHSWSLVWSLYQSRLTAGTPFPERLRLSDPSLMHLCRWRGPKDWKIQILRKYIIQPDSPEHIQLMLNIFAQQSPELEGLLWTSKQRDSIPTLVQNWVESEPLSVGRGIRPSSSESFPTGGEKSSKTGIRRRSSSMASST